jgi:hypothetical protein
MKLRAQDLAESAVAGVLLAAGVFCGASLRAADSPDKAASPVATSAITNGVSRPVQDIVRMTSAGVSKEVVKAYVEGLPPFNLTVDEIIVLKERSVPDDVTTALVKHAAEKAQAGAAPSTRPSTQVTAARFYDQPRFDPESYEFWWYHYAYPRTLASAYDRLYGYAPLDPFRFYRPAPFQSRFSFAAHDYP